MASSFHRFPKEMQDQIFEDLFYICRLEQRRTTAYACVCSTWKTFFEAKHFERLALTVSRVSQFGGIVDRNRRQLVKHIWLDVQFDPPMDFAGPANPNAQSHNEDKTFAYAIQTLFTSLSTWEESIDVSPGRLVLEISTCRRSFSKISTYHRVLLDECRNLPTLQHLVFPTSLAQLPRVNAVTALQFRRNDFFLPSPDMFRQFLGSLSALKKIEYEERGLYESRAPSHARSELACGLIFENLPTALTELVVFREVMDGFRPLHLQWNLPLPPGIPQTCVAAASLGHRLARESRQLQHLSASFAIDAKDFFQPFWPQFLTTSTCTTQHWVWSRLETLALTSLLLADPTQPQAEINYLLEAASLAVTRMPRLLTLELWNGNGNEHGCLFRYSYDSSSRKASLTWKGTWAINITKRTADSWRETVRQRTGVGAEIQVERLNFRPPLLTESVAVFLDLQDRVATNRVSKLSSPFFLMPFVELSSEQSDPLHISLLEETRSPPVLCSSY